MTLRVIGAGVGRTGTTSLHSALQTLLGGRCYHMHEMFLRPDDIPVWHAAALGRMPDWDEFLSDFVAAVDWPSAHYWRQLAEHYPAARVVLSTRPAETWWRSYDRTIRKIQAERAAIGDAYVREIAEMANTITTIQTFGGEGADREACIAAFKQRIDDVVAALPAERLLIFDVAEGWAPLCRFLDCTAPDGDFPRSNSVEEFWQSFGGGAPP
jgi:hypothetical protein